MEESLQIGGNMCVFSELGSSARHTSYTNSTVDVLLREDTRIKITDPSNTLDRSKSETA